jgi:hypothetical protein
METNILPLEIFQLLLDFSDFLYQIRLTQVSKYLYNNLRITNFNTIDKKS